MSRALSVLHVLQPSEGGVPAVVAMLAADQEDRGWRVGVAAPQPSVAGLHLPWAAVRDVGRALPAEERALAGIIKRFEPDVVHLHSSKAGFVGRTTLRGRRPTLFQPHAWSFQAVSGAARRAAAAWERQAARWCDLIICCSEAERAAGIMAGIKTSYVVVPNAVDAGRFDPALLGRETARRQLGLPPVPLVLCLGRLSHQKGQDLLLAAWPAVRDAVRDAQLVLVGDGPLRSQLSAALPAGAELVGAQSDVRPWLAAADVVVQPSRYEGMSLAVLEAMAAARPVVATGVEGMREAIDADGGVVVPPGDVKSIGSALIELLQDPERRAHAGLANRERVIRSHDVGAWGDHLARITLAAAEGELPGGRLRRSRSSPR